MCMFVSRQKMHVASKKRSAAYLAENTGYLYMKIFVLGNRHQASDKFNPGLTIHCHALWNIKKIKQRSYTVTLKTVSS